MRSLRGVAPMFPASMGGLTPLQGRAIIDRKPLAPTIPRQFWAGVAPGAVSTPANTPQYAPSTFTTTFGGTTIDISLPAATTKPGGECCG